MNYAAAMIVVCRLDVEVSRSNSRFPAGLAQELYCAIVNNKPIVPLLIDDVCARALSNSHPPFFS